MAAQYDIGARSMLYASFETGYRGGGFSFAKGLETYKPETIDAYTVGSKNRFFGNRLQINVEGFLWKYRNQQYSQFGFDLGTPPATVFLTQNIGRSTIYGVDVDAEFRATPTTLISGSFQYLNTNYDEFIFYVPNQGLPPASGCAFSPTTRNGSNVFKVDCSGKPAFNAPKYSFNLDAQQTIPLNDYKIVLQVGTRYRSSSYVQVDYNAYALAAANFVSNASATLATADGRYFVTGFINNIGDSRRLSFVTGNGAASLIVGGAEAPRTYGIRIGAKF